MQARRTGFTSFALALAVSVGAGRTARAEEALVSSPVASGAASSVLQGSLLGAGLIAVGAQYLPASLEGPSQPGSDRQLNEPVAGPRLGQAGRGSCKGACKAGGSKPTLRLADSLFQGNGALELLGAFVLPGRRGVTVATSDGVPTLSLSMMRTDITRGSGLCAMGRF